MHHIYRQYTFNALKMILNGTETLDTRKQLFFLSRQSTHDPSTFTSIKNSDVANQQNTFLCYILSYILTEYMPYWHVCISECSVSHIFHFLRKCRQRNVYVPVRILYKSYCLLLFHKRALA